MTKDQKGILGAVQIILKGKVGGKYYKRVMGSNGKWKYYYTQADFNKSVKRSNNKKREKKADKHNFKAMQHERRSIGAEGGIYNHKSDDGKSHNKKSDALNADAAFHEKRANSKNKKMTDKKRAEHSAKAAESKKEAGKQSRREAYHSGKAKQAQHVASLLDAKKKYNSATSSNGKEKAKKQLGQIRSEMKQNYGKVLVKSIFDSIMDKANEFDLILKGKKLPVGHVSDRKDGSKWRKDKEGKWTKIKAGKGQAETKDKSSGKGTPAYLHKRVEDIAKKLLKENVKIEDLPEHSLVSPLSDKEVDVLIEKYSHMVHQHETKNLPNGEKVGKRLTDHLNGIEEIAKEKLKKVDLSSSNADNDIAYQEGKIEFAKAVKKASKFGKNDRIPDATVSEKNRGIGLIHEGYTGGKLELLNRGMGIVSASEEFKRLWNPKAPKENLSKEEKKQIYEKLWDSGTDPEHVFYNPEFSIKDHVDFFKHFNPKVNFSDAVDLADEYHKYHLERTLKDMERVKDLRKKGKLPSQQYEKKQAKKNESKGKMSASRKEKIYQKLWDEGTDIEHVFFDPYSTEDQDPKEHLDYLAQFDPEIPKLLPEKDFLDFAIGYSKFHLKESMKEKAEAERRAKERNVKKSSFFSTLNAHKEDKSSSYLNSAISNLSDKLEGMK